MTLTAAVAGDTVNDTQPMGACPPGPSLVPQLEGRSGPGGTARMELWKWYPVTADNYRLYAGRIVFGLSCGYKIEVERFDSGFWIDDGILEEDDLGLKNSLTLNSSPRNWRIMLLCPPVVFDPGEPVCRPCAEAASSIAIAADGHSTAVASVPGVAGPFSWSIEPPDLGCKIEPINNGTNGLVTAGYTNGAVVVVATKDSCIYKGLLSLVCADDSAAGGGGAPPCTDCGSFGNGTPATPSLEFRWDLGTDPVKGAGGYLRVAAGSATTNLASPTGLSFLHRGLSTEAVWIQGILRQVKTPVGLLDVLITATNSSGQGIAYQLKFYSETNFTKIAGSGVYIVPQGMPPFVVWTVQNPDSSGSPYNRLWITEDRGGAQRVYKYTYTSATKKWTLEDDQVLAQVNTWTEINGSTRYEYEEVRQGSTVVAKVRRKFEPVNGRDELKEILEGDGAVTRTTTFTYNGGPAPTGNSYRLRQIDYPNGNWVINYYDSVGRVWKVYSAWLDQAPTTNEASCKVVEYNYTLTAAGDDGSFQPNTPRQITTRIKGQEVARLYRKLVADPYINGWGPASIIEQVCPQPGLAWNNSANLSTTNTYYTYDYNATLRQLAGRLNSVAYPDGQMAFYTYDEPDDYRATTIRQGEPNASGTDILNGTEITTLVLNETPRTVFQTTYAITNSVTRTAMSAQTVVTYLDPLNRSYQVDQLGGLSREVFYGCCGLEAATDWDGTTTTYQYRQPETPGRLDPFGHNDDEHARCRRPGPDPEADRHGSLFGNERDCFLRCARKDQVRNQLARRHYHQSLQPGQRPAPGDHSLSRRRDTNQRLLPRRPPLQDDGDCRSPGSLQLRSRVGEQRVSRVLPRDQTQRQRNRQQ